MCCLKRELYGGCSIPVPNDCFKIEYYLISSAVDEQIQYDIEVIAQPQREACRIREVSTKIEEVKMLLSDMLNGQVTPIAALDVTQDWLTARYQLLP